MYPHKLVVALSIIFLSGSQSNVATQQKRPPGGRIAVVVDERLSALRSTPGLSGKLLRRMGRGRFVALRGSKKSSDGVVFYRVSVSSRTQGWIQREAVVSLDQQNEDKNLAYLILSSSDFDRIARARIFLDVFPRSSLRPRILLLLGDAAEEAAVRLSREAARRLGTVEFTYYLNYTGLDRYNRQGVKFVFDRATKQFHYDGAAWRELIRRYPQAPEAIEARQRILKTEKSTRLGEP
jgi:hypothetical protein